jgi:tRNA A-37 threonylcarbamoyl transferase component Bud32
MLAHYRLVEKIGEGGMGVVWKALDTKLNRHVALKILPAELTADDERRLRFQREAQAAAALSHPNIAVIYEVGEHDGSPFIAMEFLEGKNLRSRAGHRSLTSSEWMRLSIPIAEGLAHAHKHGIVHRDLKPDNVMITEEGQVKILDFGLAKLVQPEGRPAASDSELESRLHTISRELTRAGKVFGTVAYMSPEQARGEAVDHRSDLFSFGVMLYELASGKLPFKAKSDVETLSAVIVSEPSPLSQVAEEIPPEAERIVRKALEKDPASRYQHADELATDLRNLRRDLESGRASIPSGLTSGVVARSEGASASGRRIPGWGLLAGGLFAAAVAVLGYTQFGPGDAGGSGGGPGNGELIQPIGSEADALPAASEPRRKMVAVLPFENLGAADDEYFAAGVTEEIIGRLAAVDEVGVISRASAFQYNRTGKSMRQIGADLGVEYILEGTVRSPTRAPPRAPRPIRPICAG